MLFKTLGKRRICLTNKLLNRKLVKPKIESRKKVTHNDFRLTKISNEKCGYVNC